MTTDPSDFQPRLRWWSHAWRIVVVLAISGVAWGPVAAWQWNHDRWWMAVDLLVGAACFVLMFWRRRWPFTTAMLTAAAGFVSASSGGPATLVLMSLATRRRWREIIPAALLSFVAGFSLSVNDPANGDDPRLLFGFVVVIVAVTIGWGMYVGSRRELLWTLRDRASRAESEQSARVTQARTAERGRIAREMHDVLAHRISTVAMHAGALGYRDDLPPDEVRRIAGIIQGSAHQAMTELREVLGILREGPGDAAPERPQPGADDLCDLIAEARATGMKVESSALELDGLPQASGRTLYRVVQEGLTNARKHAPETLVTVDVLGGPGDGLTVEVRNPLPVGGPPRDVPSSGLGLVGLSERTQLAGGRLTHAIVGGREFVLRAWLPWPA